MSPRRFAQNSPKRTELDSSLDPAWHSSKHPTSDGGLSIANTQEPTISQSRGSIHKPLDVSSFDWVQTTALKKNSDVQLYTVLLFNFVALRQRMGNSHRVRLAGRVILQVCTDCSLQLLELRQVFLQQEWRYQASPLKLGAVEVEREKNEIPKSLEMTAVTPQPRSDRYSGVSRLARPRMYHWVP